MKSIRQILVAVCASALAFACGGAGPQNESDRAEAIMALPTWSTTSEDARQQAVDGLREADMGRQEEAYPHFERAIAADPKWAMAQLYAAQNALSQESFFAHLKKAEAQAATANQAEQLWIQIQRKGTDNDDEGALALAQQLVKVLPDNARAWTSLSFAYASLDRQADARAALDTAIARAPDYAASYMNRSISFVQSEPFDLIKGEADARKGVELAPNEPVAHDLLGDALRGQGKLEESSQEYTKCAELDPTDGNCLQQRGHVNTFLGRYAEARADYDAAVALESGNAKPGLGAYRSFVYLFEGNPRAAVDELNKLYDAIDGMNVPEPTGSKLFVDFQAMVIAVHARMIPEAERLVARRAKLMQEQADRVNTPEIRRNTASGIAIEQGLLALTKKDYATAQAKAAEYIKIREPEHNPNKNRNAHYLLGMIAFDQKRYADALREFEQGPTNLTYMDYYKGAALEALGRMPDAQQMYQKVANYYFNAVGVGLVRKDALAKLGKASS